MGNKNTNASTEKEDENFKPKPDGSTSLGDYTEIGSFERA